MNLSDARRHADHLCDVYSNEIEHIGVIGKLREHAAEPMAFVEGHPEYPGRWLYLAELSTSCKITD